MDLGSGFVSVRRDGLFVRGLFQSLFSSITINPDIAEKSGALFGQTTYTIQEGLRVTGGLRYSVDSKTANGQDQVFIPALPFPVGNIPDVFGKTWHNVDWKVASIPISPRHRCCTPV